MPNKKKLLKRKLRRTVRNVKEPKQNFESRSDALISSMESLIRKMSSTPSAPSTIITQPSTPAQPRELSKEEILADIAKQREIDALKNQVHYMYDKIDGDIAARRDKSEIMARMTEKGTGLKPKQFDVVEDEIFNVQRSAAKSKLQLQKLSEHEALDSNEAHRRERQIFRDTVIDRIGSKLENVFTSPPKVSLSESGVSSYESQPVPTTPKPLGKGIGTPPKAELKFNIRKVFHDEPLSETTATDNPDEQTLAERKAKDLVDESFEQVADAAAKAQISSMIEDGEKNKMLNLLNQKRDINERIHKRFYDILDSHSGEISPDRRLEKALYNRKNKRMLEDQIQRLETNILKKSSDIKNAEFYLSHSKDKTFREKNAPKIAYNKEQLGTMKQALAQTKRELEECGAQRIEFLKTERKNKALLREMEMNEAINNDKELNELIKLRDNIDFQINNSGSDLIQSINTDPNRARESLLNRYTIVEKRVNDLSSYDDDIFQN